MPQQKYELRKTLLLDDCFKEIASNKIIELGIAAKEKLELSYTEEQFQRVDANIRKDIEFLKRVRNPKEVDAQSDEYQILKIAWSN